MRRCSPLPTFPSAPARASLRESRACPPSSFAVSRVVRLPDALLLVDIALHVRLHALRRRRVGIAGLRVVLLAVNVAAHIVLLAREALLLCGRELAVLHGALLVALDAGLFALEAGGLLGVELA